MSSSKDQGVSQLAKLSTAVDYKRVKTRVLPTLGRLARPLLLTAMPPDSGNCTGDGDDTKEKRFAFPELEPMKREVC